MKKYVAFFVLSIIVLTGCTDSNAEEKQLTITNNVVSIGAVKTQQKDTQKLTYEVTIGNTGDLQVVGEADVLLTKLIKDRIIERENQGISYSGDSITLTGEVVFDTKGLTKKELDEFHPFVKGVQFIGDNNTEYLIEASDG
ncbi:hypothetical protein VBD025_16435 [Virgibacillus flavescens]|uniref:hypothetical protein n=1 Tax=Virgibacillus flavescens TaxID=1611422 RepID=UPI003D3445DF